MRIIGGQLKGRKFNPKADKWPTRPTTDYAKEALFNILQNNYQFASLKVLDLFGGTGNITFEFASRGCPVIKYVEKFRPAVSFVKKTSKELDLDDQIEVISADVFRFILSEDAKYDIVFADPPYNHPRLSELPDHIFDSGIVAENGIVIVEHDQSNDFSRHERLKEIRKYGSSRFSIFREIES